MAGVLPNSFMRLSSRSFSNYVAKKELQELSKKIDRYRADYELFKAQVADDVIIWGTPRILIVAGDIVNYLTGNQGNQGNTAESFTLEHIKRNEPFPYPGIEKAAAKCNINFDDFRRACDRSRVDRNRAAHACDLEELAMKMAPVQDLFKKYPFMKYREPDQYLLISNFDKIQDTIEELYGGGSSNPVASAME